MEAGATLGGRYRGTACCFGLFTISEAGKSRLQLAAGDLDIQFEEKRYTHAWDKIDQVTIRELLKKDHIWVDLGSTAIAGRTGV